MKNKAEAEEQVSDIAEETQPRSQKEKHAGNKDSKTSFWTKLMLLWIQ